MPNLSGKICLVTGASRGIGRGIALQLVSHGATCYITGRKLKDLKFVEDEMKSRGLTGNCISVECDHSCDEKVENLFKQIADEQNGQLDLLVNNAFSGVNLIAENRHLFFWDQDASESWDKINNVGSRSNYICAVYASRLMVPRRKGLIVNISSRAGKSYYILPQHGITKAANDRMAKDCAFELSSYNVTFLSLWPGLVKTEFLKLAMGQISEKADLSNDEMMAQCYYKEAETPEFVGKGIAHLLDDPNIMSRSRQVVLTTDLGSEFDFKDVDGSSPVGQRSLRLIALVAPSPLQKYATYIPNWIKIPKSIFFIMLAYIKPSMTGKAPSQYE